jgi:hypothetical protein
MSASGSRGDVGEREDVPIPLVPGEAEAEQPPAWELIDTGRYMPRRIRGSCRGRVLG